MIRPWMRVISLLLTLTLLATACGDDGDPSDAETTGDPTDSVQPDEAEPDPDPTDEGETDPDPTDEGETDPPVELTASWTGVTEDTITVGISMLDFDALVKSNLSPAGWGDQEAVWEALIADLNDRGGINGRQVEAVYDFYNPVDAIDAERVCTTLTEDNDVFAVIGGFLGPLAGTADPCIVTLNETILIGGSLTDGELADARAPWYSAGRSEDEGTLRLLDILEERGETEGVKVFTMGGLAAIDTQDSVNAELERRGIEVVGTDVIEANDGDTASQDAELQVITERIKELDADTVFIFGNPAASIRGLGAAGLNTELTIWNNDPGGLSNLGATIVDKSIADGVVTTAGPTDTEIFESDLYQTECHRVVAERLPEADLRAPTDYAEDEENWFNPVRLYCTNLAIFVAIATAAGPELTHESFVEGANTLTSFALPSTPFASFGPGKVGANDAIRLSVYDHTEGDGGLVPLTDLVNVPG